MRNRPSEAPTEFQRKNTPNSTGEHHDMTWRSNQPTAGNDDTEINANQIPPALTTITVPKPPNDATNDMPCED